ncbi:hypothetical protein H4R22_001014 [Coemansia sp. RSA 1290]|nr:hypothetical protein H4R22_001014 [Coemansia sp. RSA 1290]
MGSCFSKSSDDFPGKGHSLGTSSAGIAAPPRSQHVHTHQAAAASGGRRLGGREDDGESPREKARRAAEERIQKDKKGKKISPEFMKRNAHNL